MKIGTDASLTECRCEGYTIMEYKKRELIQKGKLNPECCVRFYAYYPEYILEEMYPELTETEVKLLPRSDKLDFDIELTTIDLWDMYKAYKEGIDSLVGKLDRCFPNNQYDLLELADDINSYCGLG